MTTIIATLLAQSPAPSSAPGGLFGNPLVFMILMFVVMYFILIRPQQKRQKEAQNLQKSIAPGDHVVTIGGAHGTVTTVHEKTVTVRVAEGKIEFDRTAIASRIAASTEEK